MTFAAVGSLIQAHNVSSFTLTPSGVGDLILIEVQNTSNATVVATALSAATSRGPRSGQLRRVCPVPHRPGIRRESHLRQLADGDHQLVWYRAG